MEDKYTKILAWIITTVAVIIGMKWTGSAWCLWGAVHSGDDRVGDDETLYKNQEGYRDPTAGKAIQDASRIPHHVKEAHKALKDIASLLGFEILVLRDRKTGRVYRWKQ